MPFADPTRIYNHIAFILNAAATWGGAVVKQIYSDDAISQARIESGMEILRAIAENPKNGYHGSLATLVTINHNQFLPGHDGKPGVPLIVPFADADPIAGTPATPSEIDFWRTAPGAELATAGPDGVAVLHDAADGNDQPSPISCRYAVVGEYFKFTGLTAQVPLIQLTRAMADTGIPENLEPVVVQLSIPKLVKPGSAISQIATGFGTIGLTNLAQLRGSDNPVIVPIPDIATAQKAGAV